jgi:hypothetical protein
VLLSIEGWKACDFFEEVDDVLGKIDENHAGRVIPEFS